MAPLVTDKVEMLAFPIVKDIKQCTYSRISTLPPSACLFQNLSDVSSGSLKIFSMCQSSHYTVASKTVRSELYYIRNCPEKRGHIR